MFPKLLIAIALSVAAAFVPQTAPYAIWILIVAVVVVFIIEGVRIVPQQMAFVVERFGRFHAVLEPGLNLIIPFLDRVAYEHSLKEVPLDVPEQICITKDNTQLGVDGVIYFQVTDPRLASYGSSDYIVAITQLAQTTLRSEIGKMELDKTFESREEINRQIVAVLDEAGRSWGIKVLRYEIKSLTPPESILRAMQQQITAEREKRAVIAKSEGQRQEEINIADGEKQSRGAQVGGRQAGRYQPCTGRRDCDPAHRGSERGCGARGGRGDRRSGRAGGGESEGRGAVRRGVREPREAVEYAGHSGERFRPCGIRGDRDDGSRQDATDAGRRTRRMRRRRWAYPR